MAKRSRLKRGPVAKGNAGSDGQAATSEERGSIPGPLPGVLSRRTYDMAKEEDRKAIALWEQGTGQELQDEAVRQKELARDLEAHRDSRARREAQHDRVLLQEGPVADPSESPQDQELIREQVGIEANDLRNRVKGLEWNRRLAAEQPNLGRLAMSNADRLIPQLSAAATRLEGGQLTREQRVHLLRVATRRRHEERLQEILVDHPLAADSPRARPVALFTKSGLRATPRKILECTGAAAMSQEDIADKAPLSRATVAKFTPLLAEAGLLKRLPAGGFVRTKAGEQAIIAK